MKRWLTLVTMTAVFAVGLTVAAPPGAAQAAGAPSPINIIPSVITAAAAGITNPVVASQYVGSIVYNAAQNGAASTASRLIHSPVTIPPKPTPVISAAQKAALAASKLKFSLPSAPVGGLVKAAGPVGVAMTGAQIGVSAGNGIATHLLGLDSQGLVCKQEGAVWLSIITGNDCAAHNRALDYLANQGTVAGVRGDKVCGTGTTAGNCVQLLGAGTVTSTQGVTTNVYCFDRMNPAGTAIASTIAAYTFPTGNPVNMGSFQGNSVTELPSANPIFFCTKNNFPGTVGNGSHTQLAPASTLNSFSGYCVVGSTSSTTCVSPRATIVTKEANPTRTFKCAITGSDGVVYTASSAPFKETDMPFPAPVCPDLPAGVFPVSTKITEEGGGESWTLYEHTSTPEYANSVTMPECMDGSCLLELFKADVTCFDLGSECSGWFTDPDRNTTYTCRWGKNPVPLERCTVYAPTFKPDAQTRGEVYGDPTTGQPIKDPSQTSQVDQQQQNDCFPKGWGVFNPFEWVTKPVGCAMQTAFVPRQSVVNQSFAQVNAAWAGIPPTKFAQVVGALHVEPPGQSCSGIVVSLVFLPEEFRPPAGKFFNACPGDQMYEVATFTKIAMNVIFAILSLLAMGGSVAGVVSFRSVAD